MKPTAIYSFLILTILFISSCKKSDFLEKDFPSIRTYEAKSSNEEGVLFEANVENNNNSNILKLGFVWGKTADFISNKDTIFMENINEKNFSTYINYALPKNKEISFCGYVQTEDYHILGNVQKFINERNFPPIISDYNPKNGFEGELIRIDGDYFTSINSNYQILFGEFAGTVVKASKNRLTVKTPETYTNSGNVLLSIKMFDDEYTVGEFKLDSLEIIKTNSDYFDIAESIIEITFNSKIQRVNNLFIGEVKIENSIITILDNTITFKVPANITPGVNKISGTINNKNVFYEKDLNFISPWKRKKDSPDESSFLVANCGFNFNNEAYFYVPNQIMGSKNTIWKYSPLTDLWKKMVETEEGMRAYPFSFEINNIAYWGAGDLSGNQNDFLNSYSYNPETNSINQFPDFRNLIVSNDYYKISSQFGIGIGTSGYVIGGFISTQYPELPFFKFDQIENKWEKLGSLDKSLNYNYWHAMTGFEINGKIFIGTGLTNEGPINKFWCYDPVQDSWTSIKSLPGKKRAYAIGFSINGKGYVGTGCENNNFNSYSDNLLNDLWEYNPDTDSWREVANFPNGGRAGATAIVVNQKAYFCFGNKKNDLWEFEPTK